MRVMVMMSVIMMMLMFMPVFVMIMFVFVNVFMMIVVVFRTRVCEFVMIMLVVTVFTVKIVIFRMTVRIGTRIMHVTIRFETCAQIDDPAFRSGKTLSELLFEFKPDRQAETVKLPFQISDIHAEIRKRPRNISPAAPAKHSILRIFTCASVLLSAACLCIGIFCRDV